jgi:hypothetical protein
MTRFLYGSRLGKWRKIKAYRYEAFKADPQKEISAMNTEKIENKLSDVILSNATVGIFGVVVTVVMMFLAFSATSPTPYDKPVLGALPEMIFDAEVAALPLENK